MSQQIPLASVSNERNAGNVFIKYHNHKVSATKTVRSGIIERYTYKTDSGKLLNTSLDKNFNKSPPTPIAKPFPKVISINRVSDPCRKPPEVRVKFIKTSHKNTSSPISLSKNRVTLSVYKPGNSSQEDDNKVRTEHCDSTTDIIESSNMESRKEQVEEPKFVIDCSKLGINPLSNIRTDSLLDFDSDSDCQIIEVKSINDSDDHVSNNKERYPVSLDELFTTNSDKIKEPLKNITEETDSPNTKVLNWISDSNTIKNFKPDPDVHVISDSDEETSEEDKKPAKIVQDSITTEEPSVFRGNKSEELSSNSPCVMVCEKTEVVETKVEEVPEEIDQVVTTSECFKNKSSEYSICPRIPPDIPKPSPTLSMLSISPILKDNSTITINEKYNLVKKQLSAQHTCNQSPDLVPKTPSESCSKSFLLRTPPKQKLSSLNTGKENDPSPQKVQKGLAPLSPESMKSEFYSYLKINTNPLAQKAEIVAQNRRSTRVKNLIQQIEKNKEQDSIKNKNKEKTNDARKKYLKFLKPTIVFPPPVIQYNTISDFNYAIESYFKREKVNFKKSNHSSESDTGTALRNKRQKSDQDSESEIKRKKYKPRSDQQYSLRERNQHRKLAFRKKYKKTNSKLREINKLKSSSTFIADIKLRKLRFGPNRLLRNSSVRVTRNSLDGYKLWSPNLLMIKKAKLKSKMKKTALEKNRKVDTVTCEADDAKIETDHAKLEETQEEPVHEEAIPKKTVCEEPVHEEPVVEKLNPEEATPVIEETLPPRVPSPIAEKKVAQLDPVPTTSEEAAEQNSLPTILARKLSEALKKNESINPNPKKQRIRYTLNELEKFEMISLKYHKDNPLTQEYQAKSSIPITTTPNTHIGMIEVKEDPPMIVHSTPSFSASDKEVEAINKINEESVTNKPEIKNVEKAKSVSPLCLGFSPDENIQRICQSMQDLVNRITISPIVSEPEQEIEKPLHELEESDKEVEESDKEVEDTDKEVEESDKEVEESKKEVKDSEKDIEESDKEIIEPEVKMPPVKIPVVQTNLPNIPVITIDPPAFDDSQDTLSSPVEEDDDEDDDSTSNEKTSETSSIHEEPQPAEPEVIDAEMIESCSSNFIPLNQNIRPKSFHRSLMQARVKRKSTLDASKSSLFELSDSDSSLSPAKTPKGTSSKKSQTHEIDINKNNGAVFNAYFVDGILIIVQEQLISFWKQTALGYILGAQNMWLPHGNIQRIVLDPGCVNRRSSEMILSADNSVAYIELWTKEHKCVYRECPIADVFATIYFHRGYGLPDKKVLQLENIKGYGDDVRFAVIKSSREIIVSWCDRFSKPIKTLVRSYELAPDFQTVSSRKEMEFVSHYISSLHNIQDCDNLVLGAGQEHISVWNLGHGYLVTTLNLSESTIQPPLESKTICLYAQCDTGFLFLIQQTDVGILRLVGVNGITHEWKQLHSYKVPDNYNKLLGVIVESGVLMTCYTNGFLCWNMHSGEILAEIDTTNEHIVLPCNKYLVAIDNYQVTVQHIMSYILTHDW